MVLLAMDDADELVKRNLFVTSTRDLSSGLYGRRYFLEVLRSELAEGGGGSAALVCFSVDAFSTIVDTAGRAVADDVVRRLGLVILEVVRSEDAVVARLDDDEIGLLLPGRSAHESGASAEWIRSTLAGTGWGPAAGGRVTLSAGLAVTTDPNAATPDGLLAMSIRALRFAQASGGDQLVTWGDVRNRTGHAGR
jgi:diguanylate cyclase (GGDEF)-like protein